MRIEIGNPNAIEAYTDEFDVVRFRMIPGERVTTLILPDTMEIDEAVQTVVVTMELHMAPDTKPAWVECDDLTLRTYVCEHYGVAKSKRRPASWGGGVTLPAPEPKPKSKSKKTTEPTGEARPALGLILGEGE